MSEKNQKIEFSREQYFALLKAVYLGNWVANATRNGGKDDPTIDEYESIEDYVFSFAKQFGFEEYIEHDDKDGTHFYPTHAFDTETDVRQLIDEYEEESFWDELCDILGERDFYRKYSPDEIRRMNQEERFIKLQECIIAYENECEENGIERLDVMKTMKDYIK